MIENIKLRVILIVQARMGSTRLPKKILRKILEKPLLAYEIERLRRAVMVNELIIATTTNPKDQPLIDFCHHEHIPFYRGSEENVLERYFNAAKAFIADVIVRVSGDCPLIDPNIVDDVIRFYLEHYPKYSYVSNTIERTYPRGMDVEVFSFEALRQAYAEAKQPEEKEHVTPYFYEHPQLFSIGSVTRQRNESHHRWTVDTVEDFQLIAQLINALYPSKPEFTLEDILHTLNEHPDWSNINAGIKQKPWHKVCKLEQND